MESNEFIIENGILKEYKGEDLHVVVPESVTNIDLETFGGSFGRRDIVSIKLPQSIKGLDGVDREEIAAYWGMFLGCSKLEQVELPEGLEEIGISAFYNCKSLKKINIPASVKKIGYHAFHNCKELTYLIVTGIPLSDLEYKEKCVLGFCVSPASFSDERALEYEKYIKRYKEKLIKAAVKGGCKEALNYLCPNEHIKVEEPNKKEDLSFLKSTLSIINHLTEINKKDRFSEIKKIIEQLQKQGKTLNITDYFLEIVEPDYKIMQLLLEKANCKRISKAKLLLEAVQNNLSSFVGLYLENGFLKNKEQYKELFEIASENCFIDIKNMLLEYNNKHFFESCNENVDFSMSSKITVSEMKKIWQYKKKDDGSLLITGYKGNELYVEIPEKIGKETVSEIGEFAFSSHAPKLQAKVKQIRESIKEISIPQSVNCVATNAFVGCYNLKKLLLPNTVKKGDLWLKELYQLNSVDIPKGIEKVKFNSCRGGSLTAIKAFVPGSVKDIVDSISLVEYHVDKTNEHFSSIDGALLNKSGTELLHYSAELVETYRVPETVRVVASNASIYSKGVINSIIFPESIECIKSQAILCPCLRDIYIEGKNTVIEDEQGVYMKPVVIHGIKGSMAEQYAIKHGNTFIEL